MTLCTGCNQPIDNYPAGAYGGDWYSSCSVCNWHSEGDECTRIKQGLTRDELVSHKIGLNNLHKRIHSMTYGKGEYKTHPQLEPIMDELGVMMQMLLEEDA